MKVKELPFLELTLVVFKERLILVLKGVKKLT